MEIWLSQGLPRKAGECGIGRGKSRLMRHKKQKGLKDMVRALSQPYRLTGREQLHGVSLETSPMTESQAGASAAN